MGNRNFSEYRTGYLSSAVNVLTNTPMISKSNRADIFLIIFTQSDQKIW